MTWAGRLQVGDGAQNQYYFNFAFINRYKSSNSKTLTLDGSVYRHFDAAGGSGLPGSAQSIYDNPTHGTDLVDSNGEFRTPFPAHTTAQYKFMWWAENSDRTDYVHTGTEYVLTWEGTVDTVYIRYNNGVNATPTFQDDNRLEFTYADQGTAAEAYFEGFSDLNDPPRNFKLFKAEYETEIDAGEIIDPLWLDFMRPSCGILRTMDWTCAKTNYSTTKFSDFPTLEHASWFGDSGHLPGLKCGAPLEAHWRAANACQSHLWFCLPPMMGVKSGRVESATQAADGVFTVLNNPFVDGDEIMFHGVNPYWGRLRNAVYTVSNTSGNTFTLGIDTANHQEYYDPPGDAPAYLVPAGPYAPVFSLYREYLYPTTKFNLDLMTAELTPLFEEFRDNLEGIAIYELGNELWNFPEMKSWLWAQADWFLPGIGADNNHWQMSGYLMAHMMKVCRDVYGIENRHRWKGCMEAQLGTGTTIPAQFEIGALKYIEDNELNLELRDLFDILPTAHYWAYATYYSGNYAAIDALVEESQSRYDALLEDGPYDYYNRQINAEWYDKSPGITTGIDAVTKITTVVTPILQWAKDRDLEIYLYESGKAIDMIGYINRYAGSPADEELHWNMWAYASYSQEAADNHTAMFDLFEAIDPICKYPAQFVACQVPAKEGAWGAQRYNGDTGPVALAITAWNDDVLWREPKMSVMNASAAPAETYSITMQLVGA